MQNILLKKYIDFKKKSFMSYSTAFYKLYPASAETMWKNETDYEKILESVFNTYLDKYYFKAQSELEQLNKEEYENDEFKLAVVLAIIADTYKGRYNELKTKYKKGLYDLTSIIYIIINVDREINVLSDSITLNVIMDKIREYFKYMNQENIMDKNPFIIDILGNKIKDNARLIRKFFNALESKEAYNMFTQYDDVSYFAKFEFNNDLLDKYKVVDVDRVYEKYKFAEEFNEVSYELAFLTILKQFSIGKKVFNIIIPITANYLKDEKHIELIEADFNQMFIKDRIKFSVLYSEYNKNREVFNVLRDMGFKLVLYMDKDEMILDYSNIKLDLSVYAKDKFIENNPKFLSFANQKDIECMVVSKNTYITEYELLRKCEEV